MESDEFACRNYENKSQSRIAREREKAMNDDDLTTKTNTKFTREREKAGEMSDENNISISNLYISVAELHFT